MTEFNIEMKSYFFLVAMLLASDFAVPIYGNYGDARVLQQLNYQAAMLQRLEAKVRELEQRLVAGADSTAARRPDGVDPAAEAGRAVAMPISCSALYAIGHSLSGFYLVKGSKNRIDAVYCDFTLAPSAFETRIGVVDIKTSYPPIHFYVTRTSPFSAPNESVPFDLIELNDGGAMDGSTGVFTAPHNGTYYFAFSGVKVEDGTNDLSLHLRRNSRKIGKALADGGGSNQQLTLSLQATLRLVKGDVIDLILETGTLYDDANHLTHFSGILLDEDLDI